MKWKKVGDEYHSIDGRAIINKILVHSSKRKPEITWTMHVNGKWMGDFDRKQDAVYRYEMLTNRWIGELPYQTHHLPVKEGYESDGIIPEG